MSDGTFWKFKNLGLSKHHVYFVTLFFSHFNIVLELLFNLKVLNHLSFLWSEHVKALIVHCFHFDILLQKFVNRIC